jgi:molybdopterin-guanine dinucleotide biosynthesis protein A
MDPPATATAPGKLRAAGAILAGGRATRLGGRNKAQLVVGGRAILDRQLAVLAPLLADLVIVADDPTPYADAGVPIIPDVAAGQGPLGGIAAALRWNRQPRVFVVGCDMPHLHAGVIRHLIALGEAEEVDLVVPVVGDRPEPLHAVYTGACLPVIERRLAAGQRKTGALVDAVAARRVSEAELRRLDATLRCLTNVNTAEDLLAALREASTPEPSLRPDRGS